MQRTVGELEQANRKMLNNENGYEKVTEKQRNQTTTMEMDQQRTLLKLRKLQNLYIHIYVCVCVFL